MQKAIVTLAALFLLAGCDQHSGGPLPHALAALRDGNYEDFLAAKNESDEEIKGAIQPNDDLCLTSPKDFTKYSVQYAIRRLDHKDLFALPEEDRFVYAVKVAGVHPGIAPGSFLENAPIRRMTDGSTPLDQIHDCDRVKEKMTEALQSDGGYSIPVEEGRLRFMRDWMAAMNDKHGEKIDEKLHDAVAHLEAQGYSSAWPAAIN